MSFREEELRQIQEALRDGYRVEIDFVIRVYETQKPSLFGDTLRVELKHTYTVRWDPVGKEYALTASTGEKRFFPSWETFLSYFSRSPRFPIPSIPGKTIFGLSQVVLKPQLFNPPLQILNVVGHAKQVSSTWIRVPL